MNRSRALVVRKSRLERFAAAGLAFTARGHENGTGLSEADWMASHEPAFAALAASGRLPTFAKVLHALPGGFDLDLDALFELALRAVLDGVNARIAT